MNSNYLRDTLLVAKMSYDEVFNTLPNSRIMEGTKACSTGQRLVPGVNRSVLTLNYMKMFTLCTIKRCLEFVM